MSNELVYLWMDIVSFVAHCGTAPHHMQKEDGGTGTAQFCTVFPYELSVYKWSDGEICAEVELNGECLMCCWTNESIFVNDSFHVNNFHLGLWIPILRAYLFVLWVLKRKLHRRYMLYTCG